MSGLASGLLVTAEELADGSCRTAPVARQPTQAPAVWDLVTAPGSYAREPQGPARFAVGDRVRTRRLNPAGHTRLPCDRTPDSDPGGRESGGRAAR